MAKKSTKDERSRAIYVDLFDFSPVSYAVLNTAGIVVNISLAGCQLLGVERARVIGHPLHSFVIKHDRRELLEHLRRSRGSSETVESELRFLSPSGHPITCRLYTKAAIYDGAQALPTMIVDQTENRALDHARLAAERQREAAERQAAIARESNVAKDRFLATVSHELRTPLAPALIAAGRLAAWDEMPDDARRLAATIKRNIELEARLIDDLLDIARVNEDRIVLRPETVDIHQLLREVIRICSPLAEIKGVSVTMHQIARAHYVHGDASRLRQVFWNLLNNAIKFAAAGGNVVVRSLNSADNLVRITVRDDGAGMDENVLNRLFSPFEAKPLNPDSRSGLGLGLAICKGIVRAHGGQIWAASDGVGHGSTFGVELATIAPQQDTVAGDQVASSTPTATLADTQASPGRQRVLLVEDDADSSEMLALLLSGEGFDVEIAASLACGLERLDDHWDIVMSDLKLPDGSGLDVARHAKRLARPPSRLIALTGFGSHDDIAATRDAGFDTHLVKPIDPEKLLKAFASARRSR